MTDANVDKLTKREEATQTFVPKHEAHATSFQAV